MKDAKKAILALERRGFAREQITLLIPEDVRARYLDPSPTVKIVVGVTARSEEEADGIGSPLAFPPDRRSWRARRHPRPAPPTAASLSCNSPSAGIGAGPQSPLSPSRA